MTALFGLLPIIAAIASNILWGSTFMASKEILAQCPPLTATMIRFFIAIVVLSGIALYRKNNFQTLVLRQRLSSLISLGLLGYTALYTLQMTALKIISSSQSAAIMLLAPVFALLAESVVTRTVRFRDVAITVLGFVGACIILFDQYQVDISGAGLQGLLLTGLASTCLGISVIQTKRLLTTKNGTAGFSVFNLTLYSLIIGALGLLPFVVLEQMHNQTAMSFTPSFWGWSLYLGVICSVAAFLLWNWAVKQVSPVLCAVTMYLKTPVALGIGALVLSEHLTLVFYAGTTLILATLLTNQLRLSRAVK